MDYIVDPSNFLLLLLLRMHKRMTPGLKAIDSGLLVSMRKRNLSLLLVSAHFMLV